MLDGWVSSVVMLRLGKSLRGGGGGGRGRGVVKHGGGEAGRSPGGGGARGVVTRGAETVGRGHSGRGKGWGVVRHGGGDGGARSWWGEGLGAGQSRMGTGTAGQAQGGAPSQVRVSGRGALREG